MARAVRLALPNCKSRPAHRRQIGDGLPIPRDVAPKLGPPVSCVASRHSRAVTSLMAMPKASMHEQRDVVLGKNDVRIAGKIVTMEAEP